MNHAANVILLAMSLTSAAQVSTQEAPKLNPPLPLQVSLVRDLSSSKARAGDIIELNFSGEMRDAFGTVLLNRKTKFYGHVSDAAKRDKQQPEARLGIIVDRAETEGKTFSVKAVFCGGFLTPPQLAYGQNRSLAVRQRESGLPGDLELKPSADPKIGAVLVSKRDNIDISSNTVFYICQQPTPPATPVADNRAIVPPTALPAGVTFAVQLAERIDAKTAKPGDPVHMIMIGNLRGPHSTIAIPKGADIIGRILVAAPASKTAPSRIGIVAEWANWVPLTAFISRHPVLSSDVVFNGLLGDGVAAPDLKKIEKEVAVDLQQITLETTDGATVLSRPNKNIVLPKGCILTIRQSE